jgi:alkylation response protein AidB-like acyl-CoA dehydrogenase
MMFSHDPTHPDADALSVLRADLARLAVATDRDGPWRSGAFDRVASSGLLAGFILPEDGGSGATEQALLEALAGVASACLTTALVLTQWASACRLIATGSDPLRARLLPRLARGEETTTVGIAQLTTSRRHVGTPALRAVRRGASWSLDGICPWVTGADSSDSIVTGAATDDGTPMFFVVPTTAAGLTIQPPMSMLALSGSRTSSVAFAGVEPLCDIAPAPASPARAGGLATTALAIGASRASIALLARESAARPGLASVADRFRDEVDELSGRLGVLAAAGAADPADRDALRTAANGLVVRVAQAALTATKGAGFVTGHPAERGVREAMLFLVWSCPQQVATAVLCELAHLDGPA